MEHTRIQREDALRGWGQYIEERTEGLDISDIPARFKDEAKGF